MVGILGDYSELYLWAAMSLTFFLFCIPILFLYGAVKKMQPLVETLEIAFYSLLFLLTLMFYPLA
ncbi:MAG: hypothetical protein JRI61_02570 [Deltaproteobacteria bacterium]|nr:hypothetical protein [Deltaproteobacteria bacterium]